MKCFKEHCRYLEEGLIYYFLNQNHVQYLKNYSMPRVFWQVFLP